MTFPSGVLCSTLVDVSLIRRYYFLIRFWLCLRVVPSFWRVRQVWMLLSLAFFTFWMAVHQSASAELRRLGSLLSKSAWLLVLFDNIIIYFRGWNLFYLWRFASTATLSAMVVLILCCIINVIGAINEFNVKKFFRTLMVAASVWTIFAMWAFKVSAMTFLRNGYNLTWSTTPYTTGRIHFWALWYDVRRMASNDFSTSVASSRVTDCLTAVLASAQTCFSSEWSSIYLHQFSVALLPCSGGTVSIGNMTSWLETACTNGGACRSASLRRQCGRTVHSYVGASRLPDCPSTVRCRSASSRLNSAVAYQIGGSLDENCLPAHFWVGRPL